MSTTKRMMSSNSYVILNTEISIERGFDLQLFEGRKKAHCAFCNEECKPGDGSMRVLTPSNARGITICSRCAHNEFSYSSENVERIGTPTSDGITVSCELETSANTLVSRAVLSHTFKCKPTSDGSIASTEWKTPIYDSKQGFTKLIGAFEALMSENYVEMDDDCGSHLHTGLVDDSIDFRYVFPNVETYFKAFGGVYAYLDKMPNAKMQEYFGRGFVGYARTLRYENGRYVLPKHNGKGKNLHDNRYLDADDDLFGTGSYNCTQHLLAFNFQHSYSMEFRLAKFTNAKQYRKIAIVMQNVVDYIRKYHNSMMSVETLSDTLVALFKEQYPY